MRPRLALASGRSAIWSGVRNRGRTANTAGASTVLIGAGAIQLVAGLAPVAVPAVRHLEPAGADDH